MSRLFSYNLQKSCFFNLFDVDCLCFIKEGGVYKYIFFILIVGIIGGFGFYKYRQHETRLKMLDEISQYSEDVKFQADLGKVLVLYYSLDGHTKDIAERIAKISNGDVLPIQVLDTYEKPLVYWKSKKYLDKKLYPSMDRLPSLDGYHTIFVGGPVWWGTMALPLYGLLDNLSFGGRRVVPFSTQASNYGNFFVDFAARVKNANLLESENFNNWPSDYDTQLNRKIIIWLNKLSYVDEPEESEPEQ